MTQFWACCVCGRHNSLWEAWGPEVRCSNCQHPRLLCPSCRTFNEEDDYLASLNNAPVRRIQSPRLSRPGAHPRQSTVSTSRNHARTRANLGEEIGRLYAGDQGRSREQHALGRARNHREGRGAPNYQSRRRTGYQLSQNSPDTDLNLFLSGCQLERFDEFEEAQIKWFRREVERNQRLNDPLSVERKQWRKGMQELIDQEESSSAADGKWNKPTDYGLFLKADVWCAFSLGVLMGAVTLFALSTE